MLLVPLMNEVIAPENEPEDWAIVLWMHGIILISTNIFFCFLCSSRPAPWTLDTYTWKTKSERRKVAPITDKAGEGVKEQV